MTSLRRIAGRLRRLLAELQGTVTIISVSATCFILNIQRRLKRLHIGKWWITKDTWRIASVF